jgi:ribonuclease VapC
MNAALSACVVDSSAIMALVFNEPDAAAIENALLTAPALHMSTVTQLEVSVVALAKGVADDVAGLLQDLNIRFSAFDTEQSAIAAQAYQRFGKGRHPAGLNFGDCCSYALAKALNLPLLFKGNDFAQTDIGMVGY